MFLPFSPCSKKSLSPSRNIAVSDDLIPERCRHFDFEQCLRYLKSQNTAKQLLYLVASRYKKFTTCGPDSFLLHFQKSLRKYNVGKVLNYIRSFEILDEADCGGANLQRNDIGHDGHRARHDDLQKRTTRILVLNSFAEEDKWVVSVLSR